MKISINENEQWMKNTNFYYKIIPRHQMKVPTNRKSRGCMWVYKMKFNSSGQIIDLRQDHLIRGYSEIERVDYNIQFFLVIKIIFIRVLLTLSGAKKLTIHPLDTRSAFLNRRLEEFFLKKKFK